MVRHIARFLGDAWKDILIGTLLGVFTLPFLLSAVRACGVSVHFRSVCPVCAVYRLERINHKTEALELLAYVEAKEPAHAASRNR